MSVEALASQLQNPKREVGLLLEYGERQRQELEVLSSERGCSLLEKRTMRDVADGGAQ